MSNRYVLVTRHGTKQELSNRYDLPIYENNFCQDKKNITDKLNQIRRSPNKKIIYSSPFLRTRQTAGRIAKHIGYTDPIYIEDGLGESFESAFKQLKKCGENSYRVATEREDPCMQNLSESEYRTYRRGHRELQRYRFSPSRNSYSSYPKNKKEQEKIFNHSVRKIMNDNPEHDVIIVTHAKNTRKSPQALSPCLPRLSVNVPTCGGILYEQDDNRTRIVNARGLHWY